MVIRGRKNPKTSCLQGLVRILHKKRGKVKRLAADTASFEKWLEAFAEIFESRPEFRKPREKRQPLLKQGNTTQLCRGHTYDVH
jgi:hypothetical protein